MPLLIERDDDTRATTLTLVLPPYGQCNVMVQRRGDDELAELRAKSALLDWAIAAADAAPPAARKPSEIA